MTSLTTDRLILRRPDARDWPAWRDFCTSGGVKYIYGDLDVEGAFRAFGTEIGHWEVFGYGNWSVALKDAPDTPLGLVGPWTPPKWPEPEIGWIIYPAAEGKGIAFEAASAARRHAYEVLGWSTAVSYIDPDNARSIALAERLGARLDPNAPRKEPEDLVYRHPTPQEMTDAA